MPCKPKPSALPAAAAKSRTVSVSLRRRSIVTSPPRALRIFPTFEKAREHRPGRFNGSKCPVPAVRGNRRDWFRLAGSRTLRLARPQALGRATSWWSSRVSQVRAVFPNPSGALIDGQLWEVNLEAGRPEEQARTWFVCSLLEC
jgi:hypothetical protein